MLFPDSAALHPGYGTDSDPLCVGFFALLYILNFFLGWDSLAGFAVIC